MRNLTKTILTLITAGLVTTAVSTQEAQAAKIKGTIDFAGSTRFDEAALQNVTKVVEFRDVSGNPNKSNVAAVSGDFGTVSLGTQADMALTWQFLPAPGLATPGLWSVMGTDGFTFTFNLLSSTVVMRTATFLNVKGTGTITSTNPLFEDTAGKWAFTVQNAGGGSGIFFSFSANNSTAVPDGGSAVALLGISLVAIEFVRRKLRFRV